MIAEDESVGALDQGSAKRQILQSRHSLRQEIPPHRLERHLPVLIELIPVEIPDFPSLAVEQALPFARNFHNVNNDFSVKRRQRPYGCSQHIGPVKDHAKIYAAVLELRAGYQIIVSVPKSVAVAYELKATIVGIQPPIWRRLQVPSTMPLCCLHDALQATFGWTDSHLHQFERDGSIWSIPDWYEDADDIEVVDEGKMPVSRVLKAVGDSMMYEYDFGDDWKHEIVLERILVVDSVPVLCLGGERCCPPEDVGGVGGYEEFLDVIFEPDHEEFDHYRQWAGDGFWPERFNLQQVNDTLTRMRWPKRHRRS